jgi:putative transposase
MFLKQAIEKHQVKNWAYVFMPDHLHFILEGESKDSDLWKAVVLFKQLAGFWLLRNQPEVKWQKDFYDHVLRRNEELKKHIYYILKNPVRQGLVANW